MKLKQLIISVGLGLGLSLGLLVGMVGADGPVLWETNLTPGGTVYEVNPDTEGNLWLNEYKAHRVWQFNRATLAYTIYNGLSNIRGVRRDNNNNVWWTDADNGRLGRIDLTAGKVTTWTLSEGASLRGITFDADGQVWVTKSAFPGHIYRFNLTSTEVCSYSISTLPEDNGGKGYIVYHAGNLWLGDRDTNRLVKLDPAANRFTFWQLPFDSFPVGLAVDGDGNLWWADVTLSALGRLDPIASRVSTYTLPVVGKFKELIISDGIVWYTAGSNPPRYITPTFGMMNPTIAVSSSIIVTSTTITVTPNCANLGPGITTTPVISAGIAAFTSGVFTPTVNSDGWIVYELPISSSVWGIADAGGVWLGDIGRNKLLWFSYLSMYQYLPVVVKK